MNSSVTLLLQSLWNLCSRGILLGGFLCSFNSLAAQQVHIYSDVFVASNATLAIHSPQTHFINGIIDTPENNPGRVSFVASAHGVNPHEDSHVAADVLSHAHTDFIFPVGDQGIYQPLQIHDGDGGQLTAAFKLQAHSNPTLGGDISAISSRFYWTTSGNKQARLSLSWNSFSELSSWVDDVVDLTIAVFDGSKWEAVASTLSSFSIEGNFPTSLSEGAIRTVESLDMGQIEAVTLAKKLGRPVEMTVADAITPNNDGINDYWVITGIENFPQANIKVYNRWGSAVFSWTGPTAYANNWAGTYKGNTLPAGSYYYRIDLDNNGQVDLEGWIYLTN